jgi:hypothetical protein
MPYVGHVSTASNRADWQEACVLVDEDTGDLIDISLCRITMTVTRFRKNPNSAIPGGYYDYPVNYGEVILTGSTDTGEITLPDVGTFQWLFPASRMNCLHQGEYQLGVRISQDTRIAQLIIGTVNIDEGIDQQ